MSKGKMEKIKDFIELCPLLKNGKINVDYLENDIDSYSIDRTPVQPEDSNFVDGSGGRRQIAFDFSVQAPLSKLDTLANSKFCEDFTEWIKEQNRLKKFPNIKGAFSIKCTSPRIYFTKK